MRKLISILALVFLALPAFAQSDTTDVAVTAWNGQAYCAYHFSIDHSTIDSTATYETQAFFIGNMDSGGLTTYFTPSADTVGITVDVSNDLTNWYTFSWSAADSIITGTTLDFGPAGFDGFRYASLDVGWTNGTVGTTTGEVFVRKRFAGDDCRVSNR